MISEWQQNLIVQGFGAFAGAFFAFLFLRLSEFLTKIYQRELKHYNLLVNLETQLNEIGDVIHDNIYVLPNFRRVILSGNIYFNNLHQIPMDKGHYENLYDIDLINDLFIYYYEVRKLNDDIQTATCRYQEIKNAFIQKNINKSGYVINAQLLADNLKFIEAFLVKLQKDTVLLIAKVRIRIKMDKPLGTKLQFFFVRSSKINDVQLQQEITNLKNKVKKEQKIVNF